MGQATKTQGFILSRRGTNCQQRHLEIWDLEHLEFPAIIVMGMGNYSGIACFLKRRIGIKCFIQIMPNPTKRAFIQTRYFNKRRQKCKFIVQDVINV